MTPDKLRAFSGVHLKYEVEMCHFTAAASRQNILI